MTIIPMKSYSYELTYLELAKLFITTQNQIAAWIKRSKFNLNKPSSIFEFYRTEGMKIVKRREEFDILLVKYKSRTLKAPKEKEYVERMEERR